MGVGGALHVTKPEQLEHHILRSYVGLEDECLKLLAAIWPPYNAKNVTAMEGAEPKDILRPGLNNLVEMAGSSHT